MLFGLTLSAFTLILANLVPLVGVLFFGWDAVLVLALFWIENLIIGAFNVLRMAVSGIAHKDTTTFFLMAFFLVHYGAFCAVHGKILLDLLGIQVATEFMPAPDSTSVLSIGYDGAAVLRMLFHDLAPAIWLGTSALLVSKLISFSENFLLRGEFRRHRPSHFMMRPYAQIFVLHAGLLLGAAALQYFDSPIWLLVVIVVLKMLVDYRQFLRRNKGLSAPQIKDF